MQWRDYCVDIRVCVKTRDLRLLKKSVLQAVEATHLADARAKKSKLPNSKNEKNYQTSWKGLCYALKDAVEAKDKVKLKELVMHIYKTIDAAYEEKEKTRNRSRSKKVKQNK